MLGRLFFDWFVMLCCVLLLVFVIVLSAGLFGSLFCLSFSGVVSPSCCFVVCDVACGLFCFVFSLVLCLFPAAVVMLFCRVLIYALFCCL